MAIRLPSAKRIHMNEEFVNYYQDTKEGQEYAKRNFGTDFGIILTPCVICVRKWVPFGVNRPIHLADHTKYYTQLLIRKHRTGVALMLMLKLLLLLLLLLLLGAPPSPRLALS